MNKIQTPGRHPLSIPVKGGQPIEGVRLVGNQPGKTLVVTAGVHGDEYVGIQAVRELLAQLSPGELSGQVIFVPVVNAGGCFAGTYRKRPSIPRRTSCWTFTAAEFTSPWSPWRSFPWTPGRG